MTTSRDHPQPQQHHAVLHVQYDGTPFSGWTRQPDDRVTIEGDLLAALETFSCSQVQLRCAGRTDAGVHASAQIVDVRYLGSIRPERLALAISGITRRELVITRSAPAIPGFNARADATSRAYEYRLLNQTASSPQRDRYLLHHPRRLDRGVLDEVAAAILGQHRFTAFTPTDSAHVYFDRTISVSRWIERDDELVYEIRANAFLRHMVRVLVGTMLAAARGECSVDDVRAMLAGAPRSAAFQTAPPRGLCLADVTWELVEGLPKPPSWRVAWPSELRAAAEAADPAASTIPFCACG